MNSNPKLSYAIAAILSGSGMGVGISHAATATDTSASDSDSIQEIVVTAQRRNESIQDVPITIQAITGDQLKQLNVVTFDDLLRYTPNVTFSGNGPGTGNIFMRGLSSGGSGNQSQSTTAPFPNVALYLDDQSMQFPARNNDVYMVDMERVEVLEGPQGTLFGGGAQAGAIRYITNKPKLDVTEAQLQRGLRLHLGRRPELHGQRDAQPAADRGHLGGARDDLHRPSRRLHLNVPGTIPLRRSDHRGRAKAPGTPPTLSPVANNAALVGDNTNPVTYTGMRLSVLWKINDNWNAAPSAELSEHGSGRLFQHDYPVANDGQRSGSLPDHRLQPGLRQGQVREHGLDAQRQFGNLANMAT